MSSFNCLIATILLIVTYVIFTNNYPQYKIYEPLECIPNNTIKFTSLFNHIIFIFGNIYLLSLNKSFEEFQKKVYIPCIILQITYLWTSLYIMKKVTCTNYYHLTQYYSFTDSAFWISAYGLYIKSVITQLFF